MLRSRATPTGIANRSTAAPSCQKLCSAAVGERRARSKTLEGLPDGIRIHRCEHHYIVWLDEVRPTVIAILHERMDFVRRLKARL